VERVTGIGGFFFRAEDPEALANWYEERLGVDPVPQSYEQSPWRQQEGATAFGQAGETVSVHPERYPNGRFAELRDPEGNGIQLWQPMDPA